MKLYNNSIAILFVLTFLFSCSFNEEGTKNKIIPDEDNGGILLQNKFGAIVVADSLGRGRHLVVNENGDIYVHLRKLTDDGHGIITMRDTTGDGRANIKEGFSKVTGTGIELHNGYLYYSSRTNVFRSPMIEGSLLPSNQIDTLVHLVDGSGHMEKPFTFDGKGNMLVNVGSSTNACQEEKRTKGSSGIDPCIELETRAGIWKFDENKLHQKQDLSMRYATGIRNSVALTWNTEVDKLFALQHGRDDLHRFWPDYFSEEQNLDLPAEEFLEIEEGDDFGWPYCYWDPFKNKKFLNPEYGGDGIKTERCTGIKEPIFAFPGHWAPNDLLFYKGDMFPEKYKNGAFIAWHGSWNRLGHHQAGFNVVFVPMKDGKPSGNWEIFADGFKGPKPIENTGDAVYRPCGLAEGPDGSLYVVDSQVGRVWRIMYYPDGIKETVASVAPVEEIVKTEEKVDEALLPGKAVYDSYCLPCHMSNGMGAPGMNPPLVGTDWVLGDKGRLIKVVLQGLDEPIEIQGEIYQNVMASHAFLSDQQIADALTFVRQSFGNDASEVNPEEVSKVRNSIN
ncbi:MAG: PQQ-dependent sugar dehydrogenase [Cyclobacteriaceae bacterium]|nr:PQQ-dependent sugar dehydrogenase [Cyclobacteriaceae bacterium]